MAAPENSSHGRIGITAGEIIGGKFQIGPMLGRGGMSVVYEARHVQLGQLVAVKVLIGASTARADFERILVEAQATARLMSEHVVRVMDVGTTTQGKAYVVMEKLVGQDLGEKLKNGAQFSVPEAVKLVLEACHGIAEAHAAGIVHRDLKPSNLFLAQKPDKTVTLKVLDFGLASASATTHTPQTTARGSTRGPRIAGSPGYASPEQLGTASDADARADIWGLGIVLYELVAGQRPFEAKNLAEALVAAATLPMPPLVPRAGMMPAGFEAVVRKCLEKDREDRFSTIPDLAEALRPFAPANFQHYVDRIKAVGRAGFSVRTVRVALPNPDTATIGTFATDTSTFTQTADHTNTIMPPSSMAPASMLDAPTSAGAPGGLVTAAIVPQRALLFGLVALVTGAAVFFIMMSKRPQLPPQVAVAPPSSVSAAPSSATALGPLGPLAALDAGLDPAAKPTDTVVIPVTPVAQVTAADLPTDKTDKNDKPEKPRKHQPQPSSGPKVTPPAPKPAASNPMGYR